MPDYPYSSLDPWRPSLYPPLDHILGGDYVPTPAVDDKLVAAIQAVHDEDFKKVAEHNADEIAEYTSKNEALALLCDYEGFAAAAECIRRGIRNYSLLPQHLSDTRDGRAEAIGDLRRAFDDGHAVLIDEDA